jgi:hypothetical protein
MKDQALLPNALAGSQSDSEQHNSWRVQSEYYCYERDRAESAVIYNKVEGQVEGSFGRSGTDKFAHCHPLPHHIGATSSCDSGFRKVQYCGVSPSVHANLSYSQAGNFNIRDT